MKKHFFATVLFAIPNVIYQFAGILKNKILALALGAEGLGIVAMCAQSINTLVPLSTLGSQLSIVKHAAGDRNSQDTHRILLTTLIFVLFNALILSAFLVIFRNNFSLLIFSSTNYFYAIIIIAMAIPFFSLSEILVNYLKSRRLISSISLGNSMIAVVSVSIAIPLIYYYKIKGGLLQVFTSGFIAFFVLSFFIFRKERKIGIWDYFNKGVKFFPILKSIVSDGFVLFFVPRMLYILSLFLVRIMLVKHFGFMLNGIYEAVSLISVTIFSFFQDTVSGYFLPSICGNDKKNENNHELNETTRFVVLMSVPVIILIGNYIGKFLITLLFSNQFQLASDFLYIRLIAEFFFLIDAVLMFNFMANSNRKIVVSLSLFYNSCILGLAYLLPMFIGFKGYFVAYLVANIFLFIGCAIFLKTGCAMSICRRNYKLIFLSAGLIAVCFTIAKVKNTYLQFSTLPLLIIWVLLNFNMDELRKLKSLVCK